jgi:hypothetical protein
MKKILSILCGIAFLPLVNAVPIYALHINGINTTPGAAQLNLVALENSAAPITKQDDFIWNVVYNPSKSDSEWTITAVASGVWDMLMQKINTGVIDQSFTSYTNQQLQVEGLSYAPGTPEYQNLQATILQSYQQQLLSKGGDNMSTVVNNFNQAVDYSSVNQLLSANAAIVLLPHSQGNAYANGLYNYVTSEGVSTNRLTIFGFGTPMPEELGVLDKTSAYYNATGDSTQNSNYVTSTHDVVINYLSRALPNNVLPANVDVPINLSADPLGHDLDSIYLADSDVDNKYVQFLDVNYQYFTSSV